MSNVSSPNLLVERPSPDTLLIKLSGDIRGQSELLSIGVVRDVLDPTTGARLLLFESAGVSAWDSRFVAFIRKCAELCRTRNIELRDEGLPEGVRRLLRLPNGASINNQYDTLGRLTTTALVNSWGHSLDAYVYGLDLLGLRTNITRQLGLTTNNVAVAYDAMAELSSWTAKEANGTSRANEQLGYGYDAGSNLHLRTNNALVQTFTVDTLNQLSAISRTGTLTVSGALPAPASSVTVNGTVAQTYGDLTFAATGNTLANGLNSFTNVAANVYGVALTNTITANLPATVTLQYDANGNLTNDGTRAFYYDAENRLTNITVASQWQSVFVYDGLNRRRITTNYTWNGSWAVTNVTRYIYDGMLVLQERSSNNTPLVTYTRGLDLSTSLAGAGGIGGMLARTDTNGTTYYHADGNGNITALMDTNANIVGRAMYDPYGKLLALSGAMASTNRYWYSSKELDPSGLYYFGFRFYEPNFSRWLNRDPIGESGGNNLYGFVGNNPISAVDLFGLLDCDALKAVIAHLTGTARNAIGSLSGVNQMFDSAKISAAISLGISAVFAARSIVGLADDLAVNASKTTPILTQAPNGTLPIGIFTSSGTVATAGTFEFNYTVYTSAAASKTGAALIAAKEAGAEIGQEGVQDASKTAQRILDPYGRLADVQNEIGADISASIYQAIQGLQNQLRNLKDQYKKKCCK